MALGFANVSGSGSAVFPMEAQAYLAVRPRPDLTAYADVGLRGSQGSLADAEVADLLWARELFLMKSALPYNSYVRVGRFSPPFGWRVPDHTAFTRAGLGFDQFRQVYGMELGLAPNEGYGNLALWRQGLPGWPGDFSPGGTGVTAQGGAKRLGYQLGASVHAMKADPGGQDEFAAGPLWAVNLHPLVYLGELDYRRTLAAGQATDAIATYQELRWERWRGLTPLLRYEAIVLDLSLPGQTLQQRVQVGALWNPYKFIQLEANLRTELQQGSPGYEALLQVHAWVF